MHIFVTSQASAVLEDICVSLPKKPKEYVVALIPTAANLYDNPQWIQKDRSKLVDLGFKVVEVDISVGDAHQLKDKLSAVDIIFVAGGNTMYLMEQTVNSGFGDIAQKLVKKGVIYIGSSAGSVILAPDIEPSKNFDERKEGTSLKQTKGLGLIDFVPLPHWGKEKSVELNERVFSQYKNWKHNVVPIADTQYWYVTEEGKELHDIAKNLEIEVKVGP